MTVEKINFLLALGTVALQVGSVFLLILYIFRKKISFYNNLLELATPFALPKLFFITLLATSMSLYYSEVLGFAPCGLCWLQRVFLYPQVILFAVAWLTEDFKVYTYSIVLSVCGAIIAFYQHLLQMGRNPLFPCPTSGLAADCATRTLFEFHYITFPLMALSIFTWLIVVMLFIRDISLHKQV